MKRFLILFIGSLCGLMMTQPVNAADALFTEDFSQGLDQWQSARAVSNVWQIKNGELEAYISKPSTIAELVPTDAVWPNITDFDMTWDMTPIQGVDRNLSFGFIDTKNWYELHFSDWMTQVVKLVDNKPVWSYTTTDFVFINGTKYHLRLHFNRGKITFLNNNQVIFSEQDPAFNGEYGKIGLKASTGSIFPSRVRFDNIVVKEVINLNQPQPQLSVPLIKQTDPNWADEEYDTASQWISEYPGSNPTIHDWGCNLVSQLMVMKYHGIDKLPTGEDLSPLNLNNWLINNHGYINAPYTGLINRKIISRLTALNTDQYQTPSLEFRYVAENLIPTAIAEIKQGRPVILELDGHFVVGTGYTSNEQDLIINDPGYNIQLLSEHPKTLKSVRTYTPSFTDLSYLEVITKPDTNVQLTHRNGEPVEEVSTYIESLSPLTNQSVPTQQVQLVELAKPAANTYLITLENPADQPAIASIKSYAADGQLETNQSITLNEHTTSSWNLIINHEDEDQIEEVNATVTPTPSTEPTPPTSPEPTSSPTPTPTLMPTPNPDENPVNSTKKPIFFTFEELRLIIKTLQTDQQIMKPLLANILLKLIDLAERWYNSPAKNILITILRRLVELTPNSFLTDQAKLELLLLINVFDNPAITVSDMPMEVSN